VDGPMRFVTVRAGKDEINIIGRVIRVFYGAPLHSIHGIATSYTAMIVARKGAFVLLRPVDFFQISAKVCAVDVVCGIVTV